MKIRTLLTFIFLLTFCARPVRGQEKFERFDHGNKERFLVQLREELRQGCGDFDLTCFADFDRTDQLGWRQPLVLALGWTGDGIGALPDGKTWDNFMWNYVHDPGLYRHYKVYFFIFRSNLADADQLADAFKRAIDYESLDDPSFESKSFPIIGHSLGGKVAHAAMFKTLFQNPWNGRPMAHRVTTLITLGTPHHGTPMANGPARDNRAGGWSFMLSIFDLLYYTVGGGPSHNQVNRSDMWWSNIVPILDYEAFPRERNRWLETLNVRRDYDSKIIAYGSTYTGSGDCDNTILSFRAYCYGSQILNGAMGLESDGIVPLPSALFYDSTGRPRTRTRQFKNLNHTEIVGNDVVYQSLRQDLLGIVANSTNELETVLTGKLDFNGDFLGDVFRYNPVTGQWVMELSNGQGGFNPIVGQWSGGWQVQAADFNADGLTDFFLTSADGLWFRVRNLGGGNFHYFSSRWSPGWQTLILDLDGDRRSDVFLYNPTTGQWFECLTTGDGDFIYSSGSWSPSWHLYPADFNGDRRADLFLYNPADGSWFKAVTTSFGNFRYQSGRFEGVWQIYPADFNRDGFDDLFLYDPMSGAYELNLYWDQVLAYSIQGNWGPDWQIRLGDLDNSNTTDIFLYNPGSGVWWEAYFTNRNYSFFFETGNWSPGWRFYLTDLNNDRKGDVVLYGPDHGLYFQVLNTGYGTFSYYSGNWGRGWSILSNK